jgi:hypothetical protein
MDNPGGHLGMSYDNFAVEIGRADKLAQEQPVAASDQRPVSD